MKISQFSLPYLIKKLFTVEFKTSAGVKKLFKEDIRIKQIFRIPLEKLKCERENWKQSEYWEQAGTERKLQLRTLYWYHGNTFSKA